MTETANRRLLKATDLRQNRDNPGLIAFNFDDMQQRCDQHLEKVREQTRQLILEADAEATKRRDEAIRDGRDEGLARGMADAETEIARRSREQAARLAEDQLQSAVPAIEELTRNLQLEREQWLAEWEAAAIRMSIAVAERILRRKIEASPELARGCVTEALELAAGMPELRIHFHPDDVETLKPFAESLLSGLASSASAEVVSDPEVDRGGCRIVTQHGEIDAGLDTQLDRIADELLKRSI